MGYKGYKEMTDKLIITKATPEQVKAIDEASALENRSRSNFVKTYAYKKALEILKINEAEAKPTA